MDPDGLRPGATHFSASIWTTPMIHIDTETANDVPAREKLSTGHGC